MSENVYQPHMLREHIIYRARCANISYIISSTFQARAAGVNRAPGASSRRLLPMSDRLLVVVVQHRHHPSSQWCRLTRQIGFAVMSVMSYMTSL